MSSLKRVKYQKAPSIDSDDDSKQIGNDELNLILYPSDIENGSFTPDPQLGDIKEHISGIKRLSNKRFSQKIRINEIRSFKQLWRWFWQNPVSHLPFFYFALTLLSSLIFTAYWYINNDTAFIICGITGLMLCSYGIYKFKTTITIKKQITQYKQLNLRFRYEMNKSRANINRVIKAHLILKKTKQQLIKANNTNRRNLKKFEKIQYDIKGNTKLTEVNKLASTLREEWRNEYLSNEREYLHAVFNRFEHKYINNKSMTEQNLKEFQQMLPIRYVSRCDRMGIFDTFSVGNSMNDILDILAEMETDDKDIDIPMIKTNNKLEDETNRMHYNYHAGYSSILDEKDINNIDITMIVSPNNMDVIKDKDVMECASVNSVNSTNTSSTNDALNSSLVQEIVRNENEYEPSSTSTGNTTPSTVNTDGYDELSIFDSPLIQEIIQNENEYRKYIQQHPRSNNSNNNKSHHRQTKNRKNNNNHCNQQNNNNGNNNNDEQKENNNNNDDDDEEKKDNNDNKKKQKQSSYDISVILEKLKRLKKHSKYKKMIRYKKQLLDDELIALIYYTDSDSCCHRMKEAHRNKLNEDKWKRLYFHATNAINKLFQVFHFKNNKQKHYKQLYHGSTIEKLDQLSQEQVFIKTIMSFTSEFSVAKSFATGMLLIINGAYIALYEGHLKGADVSWISKFDEYEYVILPTTFHNFKEMNKNEIKQNGWIIDSNINVYISNEYRSNKDPLCPHSDIIAPKQFVDYNEYKTEETGNVLVDINNDKYKLIRNWFENEVGLIDEYNAKYLQLFIVNGFQKLETIKLMEMDHLIAIGIDQLGHRLHIIKAIKALNVKRL